MSIGAIFSSSYANYAQQNIQSRFQQFQQEFQQLGQDLQSGKISAAQQDFSALQQLNPQANSTTSAPSSSPIAQEFKQLAQDIQSGNLTAAQKDYTTIQQDFQNQAAQPSQGTEGHHSHHHHGGGGESSQVSQLFSQLGQELQSSNTSAAQQTYNSLLQDFQQSGTSAPAQPSPLLTGSSVSYVA